MGAVVTMIVLRHLLFLLRELPLMNMLLLRAAVSDAAYTATGSLATAAVIKASTTVATTVATRDATFGTVNAATLAAATAPELTFSLCSLNFMINCIEVRWPANSPLHRSHPNNRPDHSYSTSRNA